MKFRFYISILFILFFLLISIRCQKEQNTKRFISYEEVLHKTNSDSTFILLHNILENNKLDKRSLNHWCFLYNQIVERFNIIADSIQLGQDKIKIKQSKNEHDIFNNERLYFSVVIISSIIIILFYHIKLRHCKEKIYNQRLIIEQNKLTEKQIKLNYLSKYQITNHSKHPNALEEYNQKNLELKNIKKKIYNQKRELLLNSDIAKKLSMMSNKVTTGINQSLLTKNDWEQIFHKVNEIYPAFRIKLIEANISDTELYYCYLSVFRMDSNREAILLNIMPESVIKRRYRIRKKMGINGKNLDLPSFLISTD